MSKPSRLANGKHTKLLFALSLIVVFSFFKVAQPLFLPGVDQPQPIGPYLNGIFPSSTPGGGLGNWVVVNAYPNLTFPDPLAMVELPNQSGFYVLGKPGYIWQISKNPSTNIKTTVLDISSRVDTDGDAGAINMILHPEFGQGSSPNRGYMYLIYRYHPAGNVNGCNADAFVRVSRFTKPDGSTVFDPNTELVLIQHFDPHCWHTGGGMFFDPEGFLNITFGDAGGSNDEYGTGQQINQTLFGGLLRIDVDKDPARSHPIRRQPIDPPNKPTNLPNSYTQEYYIPNDNPWQDPQGGILEEFYAHGLRSPHRAAYDPVRDEIWVGDVGQNAREEVSIIGKASNLQWPYKEGMINGPKAMPNPLIGIDTPPVYDYNRTEGNSVIGGFVYRGSKFASLLEGKYIFGDHGTRNIWTLNPENAEVVFLTNVPASGVGDKNGISSFATDSNGELYILKLYGTDLDGGVIYKLENTAYTPDPPRYLSQTGAFTDLNPLTPRPGLVPYDVNAPLWSDGAAKGRWIALPNDGTHNSPDEQILFSEEDVWQFPPGTVLIKHFELPVNENDPSIVKRIETRFMVMTSDGGTYGVTYKWNESGTDAELLTTGDTKPFLIQKADGSTQQLVWEYPSRTNCLTCHNPNAGFVLGINTWQLNGDHQYPSGITDNQLNTWRHLGMFSNPFSSTDISGFLKSEPLNSPIASPETKIRSYLDANCAHCHRPNGVEGVFDARYSTPLEMQNLINVAGVSRNTPAGHVIIKPADPENSELWIRDNALGANAMPPLAKSVVDDDYMAVLTQWINSLDPASCQDISLANLPYQGTPINGWGPLEINQSNGEQGAGDGNPLTINGQVFSSGLGVHAYSEVLFNIGGGYTNFTSYIGVDDGTCTDASVVFEVYVDGSLAYQSPVLTQADNAVAIDVDVTGANELRLVVTDAGNGIACDHANWASPILHCDENSCLPAGTACDDGDPSTQNDMEDGNCNCAGTPCPPAGTACDDGNPLTSNDVEDGQCNCAGVPDCADVVLTDLNWAATPQNGWGPVEVDASNGEQAAGDGNPLTINGQVFSRGLGVHAASQIMYDIGGNYSSFACFIGVDDETCADGSVVFEVYTDGTLAYQSPVMTQADDALAIEVDITGVNQLGLVVTGAGNGVACDHANWADPVLSCSDNPCPPAGTACDDGNPSTQNDMEDGNCNCAGTPCPPAGTACDDGNPLTSNDVEDGQCNCAGVPDCADVVLTDLNWAATPQNGWGPVEVDASNGEQAAGDGNPLTINGQVFSRGLGVHAASQIMYDIGGNYSSFACFIGVDDETCADGSVVFEVYTDGILAYQSPVLTQADDALAIEVDITGVNQLGLVVTGAGNGVACDHANWADPVLSCSDNPCPPAGTACDDGDPLTYNDTEDGNCNCAGTPCAPAGTACDDGNPLTSNDVEDGQCNCAGVPDCADVVLTDLNWAATPQNGWGPVEVDASNGEQAAGDGNPLTINGQVFSRGLGVHAASQVMYDIGGNYSSFACFIGVDDETCADGSVVFEVYADGTLAYQSPVMTQADDALAIEVDITGVNQLGLVVTGAGNGVACDHANWADPVLRCNDNPCPPAGTACDDGDPLTYNDTEDGNCNCAGTPCAPAGTACDDGNPATQNDVEDGNCNCAGTPCPPAGTACDDGNPLTSNDVEDGQCNCAGVPDCADVVLTDLNWAATPQNGWGPVEVDASNGEQAAGDGNTLTINGQVFNRGLGVHAYSEVVYDIGSSYTNFTSYIGVDDETCSSGSVIFQVYTDGSLAYESPLLTQADDALAINVDVSGASELRLIVTGATNGDISCDHANWAEPILYCNASSAARVASAEQTDQDNMLPVAKPLEIDFYPNPFANAFVMNIHDPGRSLRHAIVRIFDVNGRIVYQRYDVPFNKNVTVELHNALPDGPYVIKVQASEHYQMLKVIKRE